MLPREGKQEYVVIATDDTGKIEQQKVTFLRDTTAPSVSIDSPEHVADKTAKIIVKTIEDNSFTITINDKQQQAQKEVSCIVEIAEGDNRFSIVVQDAVGNLTRKNINIAGYFRCPPIEILMPKNEEIRFKKVAVACKHHRLFRKVTIGNLTAKRILNRHRRSVPLKKGQNDIKIVATDVYGRTSQKILSIFYRPLLDKKTPVKDVVEKNVSDEDTKKRNPQETKTSISELEKVIRENFHASQYYFKKNNHVRFIYKFDHEKQLEDFIYPSGPVKIVDNQVVMHHLVGVALTHKAIFKGDVKIETIAFASGPRIYAVSTCFDKLEKPNNLYMYSINEKKRTFALKRDLFVNFVLPERKNRHIKIRKKSFSMALKKKKNILSGYFQGKRIFWAEDNMHQRGNVAVSAFFNTQLTIDKIIIEGYLDKDWLHTLQK